LNWFSVWPCHICSLVAFQTNYHVKNHAFTITYASEKLLRVILYYCRLMDENILLGVIAVYEAISIPNIEPLNNSSHLFRDYFSVSQPIFDVSGVTLRLLIFNLGCCHF